MFVLAKTHDQLKLFSVVVTCLVDIYFCIFILCLFLKLLFWLGRFLQFYSLLIISNLCKFVMDENTKNLNCGDYH